MKTQEELGVEVTEFLKDHPQLELCTKLLHEYVKAITTYSRVSAIPVSMGEMMSIVAQVSNIQNRLKQRMKVYRQEDKILLKGLLSRLHERVADPLSKTA